MKTAAAFPMAVLVVVANACSSSGTTTSSIASKKPEETHAVVREPPQPGQSQASSVVPLDTLNGGTPDRCRTVGAATEIELWHMLGGEQAPETLDRLLADHAIARPNIAVEVKRLDGYEKMFEALVSTPRSDWPDLVLAPPDALRRLHDSGAVIRPNECVDVSPPPAMLPVIEAAYSIGGELAAVPYGVSTPVLFFDAVEMREAGLDPSDPPDTPDELLAASRQLMESGVSPYGMVVYDWLGLTVVNQWSAQRNVDVAVPGNGRSGEQSRVDYVTPENEAGFEWILDLVAAGGLWIGGIPSGIEDLVRIVDPDEAVMSIHTSGSIGDVLAAVEVAYPEAELGVGPLPGPGRGALVGGMGFHLLEGGDAERAGAAWELISWLTAPPQLARFVVATGYAPINDVVAADPLVVVEWETRPQLRVAYDQLREMPGTPATAGVLLGPSIETQYVFFDITTALVEGRATPHEALVQATDRVNALIEQYEATVG